MQKLYREENANPAFSSAGCGEEVTKPLLCPVKKRIGKVYRTEHGTSVRARMCGKELRGPLKSEVKENLAILQASVLQAHFIWIWGKHTDSRGRIQWGQVRAVLHGLGHVLMADSSPVPLNTPKAAAVSDMAQHLMSVRRAVCVLEAHGTGFESKAVFASGLAKGK
ncbi:hypothetical protein CB1_001889002 [Camelus ferus]|nr:hypothetical protein CB1_001889002 [Camelus ferus]